MSSTPVTYCINRDCTQIYAEGARKCTGCGKGAYLYCENCEDYVNNQNKDALHNRCVICDRKYRDHVALVLSKQVVEHEFYTSCKGEYKTYSDLKNNRQIQVLIQPMVPIEVVYCCPNCNNRVITPVSQNYTQLICSCWNIK